LVHITPAAFPGVHNEATVFTNSTADPNTLNNTGKADTTVNKRQVKLEDIGATSGQYSDPAGLKAKLTDYKTTGQPIAGETITFTLGTQTMSAVTDSNRIAMTDNSIPNRLNQAREARTSLCPTPATQPMPRRLNGLSYMVNRENATVSDIQPTAVQVTTTNDVAPKNGNVDSITFTLTVDEAQDGYLSGALPGTGLANAKPITVTATPVGPGSSYTCYANDTAYVPLDPDTATAHCTITDVAVNVYDVVATIGGDYFQGGGQSVLTVYNPALGFTTGGGTFTAADGTKVNFGFNVNLKNGQIQGSWLAIWHRLDGNYIVKSNAMGYLTISKNSTNTFLYGHVHRKGDVPGASAPSPVLPHQQVRELLLHGLRGGRKGAGRRIRQILDGGQGPEHESSGAPGVDAETGRNLREDNQWGQHPGAAAAVEHEVMTRRR